MCSITMKMLKLQICYSCLIFIFVWGARKSILYRIGRYGWNLSYWYLRQYRNKVVSFRFKYRPYHVVLAVSKIYIGFWLVNSYQTEKKFFNFFAQRWEREREKERERERERERNLYLIRFQCRMVFNLHATKREM